MTSLSVSTIPIIDWRFEDDCIEEMWCAYTTCGFAVFTHVYDNWLSEFEDWKATHGGVLSTTTRCKTTICI